MTSGKYSSKSGKFQNGMIGDWLIVKFGKAPESEIYLSLFSLDNPDATRAFKSFRIFLNLQNFFSV